MSILEELSTPQMRSLMALLTCASCLVLAGCALYIVLRQPTFHVAGSVDVEGYDGVRIDNRRPLRVIVER